MPAWWGKKSSRNKDSSESNSAEGSASKKKVKENGISRDIKTKSYNEVVLHQSRNYSSPRKSRDFSGFESSSFDKGLPLPKPCESSSSDHAAAQLAGGSGRGSGSGSVSSISSSGSCDDQTHAADQGFFRGHGDNRLSPSLRSPAQVPKERAASTSPLHARFSGINLDSPSGKSEDGSRCERHMLPLPRGSPTSPSALPTPKSPGRVDSPSSKASKWRKGRLLGRGTFGHVYLGFNCGNGQMCAIKEVKVISDDQSSKESLKQLNQEINLLSQLSHVNIVQYYGSDLSEETLSVYLEYVSGGSIHKLLQEYGAFGEPVIQNYTRQILSGLAYLHGRNAVHRDIKGANILVDPNGEIKLADFGMAKHITNCSTVLSFKGSPYWMAPEVVMNTNGYSLPVDIWSLGCTVLEMATSKPPWSQYEGVAAIFKIGNSRDMPEIPDHLSNDAKSFIKLCLQREPSARPTAAQLLNHPFVRNQDTLRAATIHVTREAFPHAFDGSRTPSSMEMHSSRFNNGSTDRDDLPRSSVPRILISQRESARTIASMPVSPTSSPLRHFGPGNGISFLSPPHPSYAYLGQSNNSYSEQSVYTLRPTSRSTLDPWLEIPQYRAKKSARSPTRTML